MLWHWIIIDGNNLIGSEPGLAACAAVNYDRARDRLVEQLNPLVGELAERVTVIFDGRYGGGPAIPATLVEVQFSPGHLTADSVIERLVEGRRGDCQGIAVISSDRLERDTVEASGTHTISCRSFIEMMAEARSALSRRAGRTDPADAPATLGDFFP